MMEDARGADLMPRIQYLVLEKADTSIKISESLHSNIYRRVGLLTLYEMPEKNYTKPYPDILFDNGKPLLTDGKWEAVTLV